MCTLMAAQEVPPRTHGGDLVRQWVLKLLPALNKVLPFGGAKRLAWEQALVNTECQHVGASTVLHALLQKGHRRLDPEKALSAAETLVGCTDSKLFSKFCYELRPCVLKHWGLLVLRRLVVRVPTLEKDVQRCTRLLFNASIEALSIPLALKRWYLKVLIIIPLSPPYAQRGVSSTYRSRAPRIVRDTLQDMRSLGHLPCTSIPTSNGHSLYVIDNTLTLDSH